METHSRHLLAEYHGCDPALLDDEAAIARLLGVAAVAARATIVETVLHRFSPQGVTGVAIIEESHLSIHTWPEAGYASVDFYTCGDCAPGAAHEALFEGLNARRAEVMSVDRGLDGPGPGMRVASHYRQGSEPDHRGTRRSERGAA